MSESVLGQILDCCFIAHCTCIYVEYVLDIQDFHKRTMELILDVVLSDLKTSTSHTLGL